LRIDWSAGTCLRAGERTPRCGLSANPLRRWPRRDWDRATHENRALDQALAGAYSTAKWGTFT
jgi:hypothetical protein